MTTIFCAIKHEAEPIIRGLGLKPVTSSLYENEEMHLFITGIGKLKAAASAGFCLGRYGVSDYYINYGTAAGAPELWGRTFFAGQVTDYSNKKEFFPDIADTEFTHISLVASDVPVTEINDSCHIYDMESSGICSALKNAVTPDRIVFIKTVTDSGAPNFSKTKDLIEKASAPVLSYIKKITSLTAEKYSERNEYLDALCEEFRCSETMRVQLKQFLKYRKVSGTLDDFNSQIASFREKDLLPAPDRRHGKRLLSELSGSESFVF